MSTPPTRASQSAARRSSKSSKSSRSDKGKSDSGTSDNGKRGRKGWRRFFSFKRIVLAMFVMFLLGAGAFGLAYAKTDIPQPNDLANAQASIIYYADGKTEMARISDAGGNRESLPLSKIPPHVQHALLAAEDRSFYTNSGVSPTGIGRAIKSALTGGPTQGGSTITQQYVKNYFLTADQTLSRKAKELIISLKIDQQESKDTILENYLNTIYYGRGAFGIQTAARAYFGHDASKLTVSEGALLASVIRGPEFYDPAKGPSQTASARARVIYVLDGMVTEGWLTPAQRAKAAFPKTIAPKITNTAGAAGYITSYVRQELISKLGVREKDIDRGGLRIVTTIDRRAQTAALKAVKENLPSDKDAPNLHAGLTAIKPGDGAIVAMYGGKDYSKSQYNSSTQATMQGGSTFKVFGLLAALQKDISTKTKFNGKSPQYFPEWTGKDGKGKVVNFGGEQFGKIDLRKALAESVNTVFAQLNIKLAEGGKATGVKDAAILAGLPKTTSGLDTGITNILGTASPRVIDMANAFATIAAKGEKATPYIIKSVRSVDGKTNYKAKKELTPAFDQQVAADATEAMTHVVTEGTGSGAKALGRPVAGKTGTSSFNYAVWFDGFTPQLSAAVGMYQGNGQQTITVKNHKVGEVTGGSYPVKIWTAFMKGALQGQPTLDFPKRSGVGDDTLPTQTTPPTTAPPTTTTPPTTIPPTTRPPTTIPPTTRPPTTPPSSTGTITLPVAGAGAGPKP